MLSAKKTMMKCVWTIRQSSPKCGEATRIDHGGAVGPFSVIAHVFFHTVHVCSNKDRIYWDKKSTVHHMKNTGSPMIPMLRTRSSLATSGIRSPQFIT